MKRHFSNIFINLLVYSNNHHPLFIMSGFKQPVSLLAESNRMKKATGGMLCCERRSGHRYWQLAIHRNCQAAAAAEAAAQQRSTGCAGDLGSRFICASPAWLLTKPHTAHTWLILHHFCFLAQGLNSDQQDEITGLWNFFKTPDYVSVTKPTNL